MTPIGGRGERGSARTVARSHALTDRRQAERPFSAPRCRNGGCASLRVRLYKVGDVREPKPICDECVPKLAPYYDLRPA